MRVEGGRERYIGEKYVCRRGGRLRARARARIPGWRMRECGFSFFEEITYVPACGWLAYVFGSVRV